MGMPRQEYWISNNFSDLTANIILPSGAAIDYIAGVVPTPPRWSGKIGLEWLFRFVVEPKRLAYRYLIEPFFVLRLLGVEVFSRLKRMGESLYNPSQPSEVQQKSKNPYT